MTGTLRPRGGPMNSRPAVGTPRKAPYFAPISLGQSLSGSSALRSTCPRTESRCDDGNVSWRARVLKVPI